jgi:hypothetical protein
LVVLTSGRRDPCSTHGRNSQAPLLPAIQRARGRPGRLRWLDLITVTLTNSASELVGSEMVKRRDGANPVCGTAGLIRDELLHGGVSQHALGFEMLHPHP